MRKEKRTVDLNAYITELECDIKKIESKKQLTFSFENLNYGTIVAIKLSCAAYDSFGDKVQFEGNDYLEVKRSDLQIKPNKKAGFSIEIENCDIKKMEMTVAQIVYLDGTTVVPQDQDITEYEIEAFQLIWSIDDHFESDAWSVMREKNDKAICFPAFHPKGWICVCGNLNSKQNDSCAKCGYNREKVFKDFNEDVIKSEIEEHEKKKIEEDERSKEKRRMEKEQAEKRQKAITISVAGAIVLAVIISIISVIIHNLEYGLSDEEKVQYDIAQNNYSKIKYFVMGLGNDYNDIAKEYSDDNYNYNHERKSRLNDAEKDKEYLYSRGMYLASSLLYELLEDQYPENYHATYAQLVKLCKGDVYNDILIDETMYVKNSGDFNYEGSLLDKRDAINDAIDKMEEYMNNEVLNPAKVKIAAEDMITADYSKIYGISLGILYYEDGSIQYMGEIRNDKAEGYGEAWYPSTDGYKSCCEGIFEEGIFKNGISYDTEHNEINASELSNLLFEGEFESVKGVTNTMSSEEAAQKAADDQERDKWKANTAAKDYIDLLLEKQSSINKVTWHRDPTISEDYYYYSCEVEYGGLTSKGTITVEKQTDGTFKATGLELDE